MTDERRDPSRPERRRLLASRRLRGGRRAGDPQPADWLSVTEYAFRYGVSRGQVYKWLEAEILDTYRVESLLRIRNLPPPEHFSAVRVHQRSQAKTRP